MSVLALMAKGIGAKATGSGISLSDVVDNIPKINLGAFTIGSSPSVQFKGESSKERRERKKHDDRARKSGKLTSSMMYVRGLDYRSGQPLTGNFAENFERDFGIEPIDYVKIFGGQDATTITREDLTRLDNRSIGVPRTISKNTKENTSSFKPAPALIGALILAAIGALSILRPKRKTRTRRR